MSSKTKRNLTDEFKFPAWRRPCGHPLIAHWLGTLAPAKP